MMRPTVKSLKGQLDTANDRTRLAHARVAEMVKIVAEERKGKEHRLQERNDARDVAWELRRELQEHLSASPDDAEPFSWEPS